MNRLQSEWHRLYLPAATAGAGPGNLIDATVRVRALVMALTRPASWALLSRVWQGVQAELGLPAPAIAVSGTDALQLWFSLAEPIAASQGHVFLEALRLRFLADLDPRRVGLMPSAPAHAPQAFEHARAVPACQPGGNWSAFVAPDLAPVFDETPWLDIPPGEEGQAALLRGLRAIAPGEFETACEHLRPQAPEPPSKAAAEVEEQVETAVAHAPVIEPAVQDPRSFLHRVMNDTTVALGLRVEAAKALLRHPPDDSPS